MSSKEFTRSKIYLYAGPGASRRFFPDLHHMLRDHGDLVEIEPQEVLLGRWTKDAALFVMPGGADLPYCEHLQGEGNKILSSYVHGGGLYLGICAGAYYAARSIEFAKGEPLEVLGERELGFYPGRICGPAFEPFSYEGVGARTMQLITAEEEIYSCYYHGGGLFEGADKMEGVEILARYRGQSEAAIVRCKVGKGAAILSSVHIEVGDSSTLSRLLLKL